MASQEPEQAALAVDPDAANEAFDDEVQSLVITLDTLAPGGLFHSGELTQTTGPRFSKPHLCVTA
jgi:hypothetical protein